ncbi:unnamed protein product [Orchesella dallaii]|uniref:C2H2-type domain-containing protein n=1 Tax=Orchesella dallaii TaxID=48710 RepID=A0ABP1QNG7_9HEXA
MPPARKTATKAKEVEVVLKDEISSDEEMDTSSSRRRSSRAPKPVQKKSLKDASDSDDDESDRDSDDSEAAVKTKKGRAPAKNGKANGTPGKGKKRPLKLPPIKGNNAKKAKKGKDDDDDYSASEEDEEEDQENRNGSRSKNGDGENEDDDGNDTIDLGAIEGEEVDDPNWEEPNYKDKAWFKENCLKCQKCSKVFPTTGKALECFNKHKDYLRCFVCFTLISGKKNATKKLFKHYQLRHKQGDKTNTVKCPHCEMSVAFKSVSCHIIAIHFREALGLPNPTSARNGNANGSNGATNGRDSDEEDDEEIADGSEEEEDEEEEDDD